jgi:hypothetical protein
MQTSTEVEIGNEIVRQPKPGEGSLARNTSFKLKSSPEVSFS